MAPQAQAGPACHTRACISAAVSRGLPSTFCVDLSRGDGYVHVPWRSAEQPTGCGAASLQHGSAQRALLTTTGDAIAHAFPNEACVAEKRGALRTEGTCVGHFVDGPSSIWSPVQALATPCGAAPVGGLSPWVALPSAGCPIVRMVRHRWAWEQQWRTPPRRRHGPLS